MDYLELLTPADGTVTVPLQLYTWSERDDFFPVQLFDRGLPRPVDLVWKRPSENGKVFRYDLILSLDQNFTNPTYHNDLTQPRAEVRNLYLGQRYFWKVIARNGGQVEAESPIWSFTTHSAGPRWIRVPGITNVRDIGGWPLNGGGFVRQGRLYRSSEMNSHLSLTDEGERVLLEDLGIKTDIDLRGSEEIREPALDERRVRWVNIPIQPYENIILPYYKELYRHAFSLLADPVTYPAIVHCWGGADRTGTLVFLLEAVIGVEESCLIQDYELTSLSIWGYRSSSSQEFIHFLEALSSYAQPGSSLQTQVDGYLRSIGVTGEEINSIRLLFT